MARILPPTHYRAPRFGRIHGRIEVDARALLLALQACVIGGIALVIVLAVANSVLGTPPPDSQALPYGR